MTIKEVSEKYDLTPDTLRYYERVGLIKNVPRSPSGIRNYDEESCKRIEFIKCFRSAGIEIEMLLEYFDLLAQGKKTVSARKELLVEQKEKLLIKKLNIDETLKKLENKISLYEEIEQGKREDFSDK